ncbi:MAG: hypothetical protein DI536_21170 [Archangium gephyra]|uniref:Uncharacterized protein n=1 Tax=Archangium gephyra TaxID=48 RepID=A0A2W5ULB8_9BACT|nr:MAG: hypothetical protein DI536_21170 [Archangium gephyra]
MREVRSTRTAPVSRKTRLLLLLAFTSASAFASGLGDHGEDLFEREKIDFSLTGHARVRGDWLHNLDLDRGTTPSGRPLFAVPLGDPNGQSLFVADMRVRTDLAIYAPFAAAAVKIRADLVDNLVFGSTPTLSPGTGNAPTPAASPGQLPASLFRIKRAYGEVLTPIGYLAAGRMGNMWGLGMLSNGGDCIDCNLGDQADRLAFATALAGHVWAVAHDFSAVGPTQYRRDSQRQLIIDPTTDVQSVSFAFMNIKNDATRKRRRIAGRLTFEYGVLASYRWQTNDVPENYLSVAQARELSPASVMRRGYKAGVVDAWARLSGRYFKIEAEGAVLFAEVEQPSLIPGVLLRDRVRSFQGGGSLESTIGAADAVFVGGVNLGFASGDPAPGFGAYPYGTAPTAGELDGPQLDIPRDRRIDNFRFHPDYRIDRVLFAEIIGTATDVMYLRPWTRTRLLDFKSSQLNLNVDGTFTRAFYASSTPNNDPNLGMELHASLTWLSKDGFDVLAEYAVLFPFAAFDNPSQGLTAPPCTARSRAARVEILNMRPSLLLALIPIVSACGDNLTYPERQPYVGEAATPLECVPNLDGRIDATELRAAIGVPLRYLASPPGANRSVNLVGEINGSNQRVWDLAADFSDDRVAKIEASAVTSHWFAGSFPSGQWAAPLDLGGSLIGVYLNDGENVLLLGYATRDENPPTGKTLVVYTNPVAVYRFPLEVGKEWISVSTVVNGLVQGLPFAGRDSYAFKVESAGQLELPDVTFTQALRVRTTTTIEPAVGPVIVRRQTGWVFECFGEVARATARDGGNADDFTTTSELRRLGL